jgi:hypothetical protein
VAKHQVETHPQRQFIIDQLLAGNSYRKIATSVVPPLSKDAIENYNRAILRPALAGTPLPALVAAPVDVSGIKSSGFVDSSQLQRNLQVSETRQRLSRVMAKTEQWMGEATVDNGAPHANAATRQIELLARLTGELAGDNGITINIQVNAPGPDGSSPRVDLSASDAGDTIEAVIEAEMGDKTVL